MSGIKWKEVPNVREYVIKTLSKEADDIPLSKIEAAPWVIRELDLSELAADEDLILEHDRTPIHNQRRDGFVESIKCDQQILPLIALGENRFLVDGYSRFRALRKLNIKSALVCCQESGK